MHYYELHEALYRHRLARGCAGWDEGDWEAYAMRAQVERWLAASALLACDVLEIGCGTGALSCHLASLGFRTLGIDVAASAVAAASDHARRLGLAARFEVADACTWRPPEGAFGLVIDAHALHCIVFPADRQRFLAGVVRALAPQGEFWLETMTRAPDGSVPAWAADVDANGVVWARAGGLERPLEAQLRGGELCVPSRYLAPDAGAVAQELRRAGLSLDHAEWVAPSAPGDAADFRARCRRTAAGRTMMT